MSTYTLSSSLEWLEALKGIVLATATSYPLPVLLGNVTWSAVYFRLHYKPNSVLHSLVYGFVFVGYPGNILANLLALGRVPSAFTNPMIIPIYVCTWLLVNCCPGDVMFRWCSNTSLFPLLSFVAGVDNMSTALQFVMYAYATHPTNPVVQAMLAGVLMNVGGAVLRHFDKYGWHDGSDKLPILVSGLRVSVLCVGSFYHLAVKDLPRQEVDSFAKRCAEGSIWYQAISLFGGANAALPFISARLDTLFSLLEHVFIVAGRSVGFSYHHQVGTHSAVEMKTSKIQVDGEGKD